MAGRSLVELNAIRLQVAEAAQVRYIAAVTAGDAEEALRWLRISQNGSIRQTTIDELGLDFTVEVTYPAEAPS